MTNHPEISDRSTPNPPVLLVVDADETTRAGLEAVLIRRFGSDYRVLTAGSAEDGFKILEQLARHGDAVALVAADLRLPDEDGIEFLARVRALHRHASRALLVAMDKRGTRIPLNDLASLQRATGLGRIDFWAVKGWFSPEELLYPQIQAALSSWTLAYRPRHEVMRVIGERLSPRSHELRDALTRNTVPFGFYPVDSTEGRQLMLDHGVDEAHLPAVILYDGAVLHDPTPVDVAEALGVRTRASAATYDVAILGGGPAGLSAAVYAASEGLHTLVVEPQAIGGQAGTSSMIRNYLGFPGGVSGSDLTFRAWEQALLFGTEFVFMHRATDLIARGNERAITLSDGSEVTARTVIIATGVTFRRMGIPALDRLVGSGVFYGATGAEAAAMAGEEVYIVGGANSAGQAALHLARFAANVTLLVRGKSLEQGMSSYLITQLHATPNIRVRLRSRVVDGRGEDRLEALTLEESLTGRREEVPAAAVFILIGAEPRTEWLRDAVHRDARGFVLTGRDIPHEAWPLKRSPLPFETSMPAVWAVGDARHGSVARVASSVGEGSVAVDSIRQYLAKFIAADASGT